jgi:hypothetical protein
MTPFVLSPSNILLDYELVEPKVARYLGSDHHDWSDTSKQPIRSAYDYVARPAGFADYWLVPEQGNNKPG